MNAPLSEQLGRADANASAAAIQHIAAKLSDGSLKRMRFAWTDLHGETRCKVLIGAAVLRALTDGIYIAGTTLLKDTADRTALPVFDGALGALSPFANAANVLLRPDPTTFTMLPWSPGTGWMLGEVLLTDQRPCDLDARQFLKSQVERLAAAGYRLRCGIELEFHVYRVRETSRHLEAELAGWPGPAPLVDLIHPGYRLLSEHSTDAAHEVMELVEAAALGLGLPLASLEIEFGPSQFEAVFDVQDANEAADCVVLFRSAVRQVLARHGYLATFVCRPPLPSVQSSGWHLHQSLVDQEGHNVFLAASSDAMPSTLSEKGRRWLAGLMHHALGACILGTSTVNGYLRYQPGAMAPTRIFWGYEDRSALFRVVGQDNSLRIENRLGEPSANPYLYLASQIISGLEGLEQRMPLAGIEERPHSALMPGDLNAAIRAFRDDAVLRDRLGSSLCQVIEASKYLEWKRFSEAEDKDEFQRREYFARF